MKTVAHHRAGLTWIDILVVVATVALLAGLLIPALGKAKARSSRINCVSQLKQIGLGMRMFSSDHQDNFPWRVPKKDGGSMEYSESAEVFRHFLSASDEISSTRVLTCPNDADRVKATGWNSLSNINVSYFVGLDSREDRPASVLSGDRTLSISSKPFSGLMVISSNSQPRVLPGVHQGAINLAFGDGSAQQMTETSAKNWLLYTNPSPIRLAIP